MDTSSQKNFGNKKENLIRKDYLNKLLMKMNEKKALKLSNYVIAALLIFAGIAFSLTSEQILPFFIGFTGAAILIALYRNMTWDYKERKAYFKNSLEEIKKIICSNCGVLNPWWSEYCTNCGEKLQTEEIKCPECYNLNPPKSVYCGVCGSEMEKEEKEVVEEEAESEEEINEKEKRNEGKKPTECPECGYEVTLDVRKCPWCGHDLFMNKR